MTHWLFYKGNQPLIAIPINGSLRLSLSAIMCLPSYTLKRKLFKAFMVFIVIVRYKFRRIINNNRLNKEFNELVGWFDEIAKKENCYPVIIWSLVPGRKRFYIHILDRSGKPIWFAKLTKNRYDTRLFENENTRLRDLRERSNHKFDTSKVICHGRYSDYSYIMLEYIPSSFVLFHPEKNDVPWMLLNEIRKGEKYLELSEVFNLNWWLDFELFSESFGELGGYVNSCKTDTKAKVSFVHGDFGSENILNDARGNFKIIDWERAHDQGPYYVDEVGWWLGQNHQSIKRNSHIIVREFYSVFKEVPKLDLALALCFLVGAKYDLAIVVAEHWEKYYENTY